MVCGWLMDGLWMVDAMMITWLMLVDFPPREIRLKCLK